MGLKPRSGGDDFANTVVALTTEFPQVAAFIAGHTHQNDSSRITNGVLLTQADHFGIHIGRLDLTFDRASKKLLRREARCERMNNRVGLDHVVISRAKPHLDESASVLAQPIGTFGGNAPRARSSRSTERCRSADRGSHFGALRERGTTVDGAMHGVFDETNNFVAGPKTINDIWGLIPLKIISSRHSSHPRRSKQSWKKFMRAGSHETCSGLKLKRRSCYERRITAMRLADGRTLERGKRYSIAFNTFDSRGGGHRFMKLPRIARDARSELHISSGPDTGRNDRLFPAPPGRAQVDPRPTRCGYKFARDSG